MIEIIYELSRWGDGIIFWLSIAASIVTVLGVWTNCTGANRDKQTDTAGNRKVTIYAWTFGAIISVVLAVCSVAGNYLVCVPDVTGTLYEDARRVLIENRLKYSLLVDNGIHVIDQIPEAGAIVAPGTVVTLTVEETRSSAGAINLFEKKMNVSQHGTLKVSFYEAKAKLESDGNFVDCFGPLLKDFVVVDAYLQHEADAVKYCDYTVEDDALVFRNIPMGIEFTLYIQLSGYEMMQIKTVQLTALNTVDGVFNPNMGVTSLKNTFMPTTTFRVADEKGSFLENVDIQIKWPWSDMWYGNYATNKDGQFPYYIWCEMDLILDVCIVNPLNDGSDRYCSVPLSRLYNSSIMDDAIVFILKNGECTIISESDYYGFH